jgi:hypothetical protein
VHDAHWFSAFLIAASALRDEQNLPARVNMPIELRAGIIGCYSNAGIEGAVAHAETH